METFLTVDDLSQKLQVSRVWIYKPVREKRIPFYHIEKCVRFSPGGDLRMVRRTKIQRVASGQKLKGEPLVRAGYLIQLLEII